MENKKKLIVFIDSGDTLVNESTEVLDEYGNVVSADLIEGAEEMIRGLYKQGYRIALVADGRTRSFENVYNRHNIYHVFEVKVISEEEGVHKPDLKMFTEAMKRMGLTDSDKHRIVMVGNNLKRDIIGANRAGITSILLSWSTRYCMQPETEEETPDHVVATHLELTALLDVLERQVDSRES